MDFCEKNGIDFIFGVAGNVALERTVEIAADDIRTRRALTQALALRGSGQVLATTLGLDIRFVATNLAAGSAQHKSGT
jgi:hypothetical protein